jgi:hypothetical protein
MASAQNMEAIIQEIEKKGWRISNLSCCGASFRYSCILERRTKDKDGFDVFAASELCVTPKEALLTAWAEAQRRSATPSRVDARHPNGKRKAAPVTKTLAEILAGNGTGRLRLQVAVANCISARTGEAVEGIL